MLSFVLSSLASEGVIGPAAKEDSSSSDTKRPRLENVTSPYVPPHSQASPRPFPQLDPLYQPTLPQPSSSPLTHPGPTHQPPLLIVHTSKEKQNVLDGSGRPAQEHHDEALRLGVAVDEPAAGHGLDEEDANDGQHDHLRRRRERHRGNRQARERARECDAREARPQQHQRKRYRDPAQEARWRRQTPVLAGRGNERGGVQRTPGAAGGAQE